MRLGGICFGAGGTEQARTDAAQSNAGDAQPTCFVFRFVRASEDRTVELSDRQLELNGGGRCWKSRHHKVDLLGELPGGFPRNRARGEATDTLDTAP